MQDWSMLAVSYAGWSLTEIKELSYRERQNWLEVAIELGRVVRN